MNITAIFESVRFAWNSVRVNLLRTLLSLLGITIGVFCIIGIFTLVDSIEITINKSFERLGNNILIVQKFPWEFSSDYPFWKYEARPELVFRESESIKKRNTTAEAVVYILAKGGISVKSDHEQIDGVVFRMVTDGYEKVVAMDVAAGRYFSESEIESGSPNAVIGFELAKALFGSPDKALGQIVRTMNRKLSIIGVLAKEGSSMGLGKDQDKSAIVPYQFFRNQLASDVSMYNPTIMIKAAPGVSLDELEEEVRGELRGIRRLGPRSEDNFALNKLTMFTQFLSGFFGKLNLYGWIIAGFSILVGGFGIANIMFVSVRERVNIIGIQKALGATRTVIVVQFLAESVFLSVLGGVLGLLLLWFLTIIISKGFDFNLYLTLPNILRGLGFSAIIGVISGIFPAWQAAKLDPVESIRQGS